MNVIKRKLAVFFVLALGFVLLPAMAVRAGASDSTPNLAGVSSCPEKPLGQLEATSLLILGDSIATGYGLQDPAAESYGALLSEALYLSEAAPLPFPAFLNLAVNGATSADLLAAIGTTEGQIVLRNFDTIIISIGGNDLLSPFFALANQAMGLDETAGINALLAAIHANPAAGIAGIGAALSAPANLMSFGMTIPNAFQSNLTAIIAGIQTVNPNARIYVQTIYNPFSGAAAFDAFAQATDLIFSNVNAVITAGAAAGGYTVVDVYTAFKDNALTYTNIGAFDIHPNAAGHKVIFELYKDIFVAPTPVYTGVMPTMPVNPFVDVVGDDWFIDAVIFVNHRGLMVGTRTEPKLFSPHTPLTRGMAVTVLHRLAGLPDVSGIANPYEDVDMVRYYGNAVLWASANGIVQGSGGRFEPNAGITGHEVAAMLGSYANLAGIPLPDIGEYAGFIMGNMTRADFAALLMNILQGGR